MSKAGILDIWRKEANDAYRPVRWLPFWRPRVMVKNGLFSPWFWPPLWMAKLGVFNLFFLILISEDMLFCEPQHRRAIIAHECGHLSGLHSLIWMSAIMLALNDAIRAGLTSIANHYGPWAAPGAFLALLVLITVTLRALLYWFEHQADDYACAKVGAADMIATLSWLNVRLFGAKGSPWVINRIIRLRRIHGMSE